MYRYTTVLLNCQIIKTGDIISSQVEFDNQSSYPFDGDELHSKMLNRLEFRRLLRIVYILNRDLKTRRLFFYKFVEIMVDRNVKFLPMSV